MMPAVFLYSLIDSLLVTMVLIAAQPRAVEQIQMRAWRWIPRQVLFDCKFCTAFWLAVLFIFPMWIFHVAVNWPLWRPPYFASELLTIPFISGYIGYFMYDVISPRGGPRYNSHRVAGRRHESKTT